MSWYVLLLTFKVGMLTIINYYYCREEAAPHVIGVSGAVHRAHKEWISACVAYNTAYNNNLIKVVRVH